MTAGPIGIIVNPASGKDIRRLVARASVFDNQEKHNMVVRAIHGAVAAGARSFCYLDDSRAIAHSAFSEFGGQVESTALSVPVTDSTADTTRAAAAMRDAGCAVVLALGGDGTSRAVALGWRDAPLIALSTGTNNVFPRMMEATVAGAAAGLVASGAVDLAAVSVQAKTVSAEIEGEEPDLALVDAALVRGDFTGTRAVWDPTTLRALVLARAKPASVGLSAIGGLVRPIDERDDHGLYIALGGESGFDLSAPIAPGLYRTVRVSEVRLLALGEPVTITGPGVIAFDGERERRLRAGQSARLSVLRDGPRVIDVDRVLAVAACAGAFRTVNEVPHAN
jgi:predicted polyphosphate/ATP-dependent NAD kinase